MPSWSRAALLPLVLASASLVAVAAPAAYFPSAPGTTWRLTNGAVQKLAPAATVRGATVTPLQHSIDGRVVSEDLLDFTDGRVLLRGTRAGKQLTWYEPPLVVYPAGPLLPGQKWTSTSAGVTLSGRVEGQQALVTPYGRYNALVVVTEVRTTSGASSVTRAFFVPGLGTVRYVAANGATVDLMR